MRILHRWSALTISAMLEEHGTFLMARNRSWERVDTDNGKSGYECADECGAIFIEV